MLRFARNDEAPRFDRKPLYYRPIPARDALPSQDGDYWIFYKNNKGGSQTGVFCFFAPMAI